MVRAGPMLADAEHAVPPATWSEGRFLDGLARLATPGVDELIWDLNIVGHEPAHQVALLEKLAPDLGLAPTMGS